MNAIHQLMVEESSTHDDVMALHRGLEAFNRRVAGDVNYRPLNIFVRDDAGTVIGGLLGATYWTWLAIEILWLHEDLRGRGLGTQLVTMAEQEATRRGARHTQVDTVDFQALGFYQKLGYAVFGQLEDCPEGHTRYYLAKDLSTNNKG
ncbi:MAG: GNAT family N-acetyltransferase [Caldilineaceae bacterium]|nr:GNAT family N-acetyltransferase [Caldilineaceae bacterium]